jgi:toxin ParE1/3/4
VKREYRLSDYAEKDLVGIFDYTLETWGETQFRRYHRLLNQALESLCRDSAQPRSKKREELFRDCKSLAVGRHFILYRLRDDVVEIARVLHQSMDLERHIPEDWPIEHE